MIFFNRTASAYPTGAPEAALGRRERSLLSETAQIEEEQLPAFVRPMLYAAAAVVLLFVLWAVFVQVREVAKAPGEVLPVGNIKVVQHLEGGIVAEIPVEEHTLVKAGQVVLRLQSNQALTELAQTRTRLCALRLRAERLSAFANGRAPDFAGRKCPYPELVASELALYRQQVSTRGSTLSVIDQQIAERAERMQQSKEMLSAAQEHQSLTGQLLGMREDLAQRRLVTQSVLLETRRAKVTADGEVARLSDEISVNAREISESRQRQIDARNQLRRDALTELSSVQAEINETQDVVTRLEGRTDHLVVRAPIQGYVQDLKVTTIGQVISPGATVMQIVPDAAPLEVAVRIQPKDIGHVSEGQPVNIRVSSYDYTRFGYATGVLRRISASSVPGEDNKPYFHGWVALDHPYLGSKPGEYPLQPGMSLEAEIVTGEKSLLAYLAKPVIEIFSSAFHER